MSYPVNASGEGDPINTDVSGDTPAVPDASYANGSVSVGTTATLICVVPEGYIGGVTLFSTAAVFIGGADVTTTNGFALPATTAVTIPGGKGNARALYGIVASTDATVSYIFPEDAR